MDFIEFLIILFFFVPMMVIFIGIVAFIMLLVFTPASVFTSLE